MSTQNRTPKYSPLMYRDFNINAHLWQLKERNNKKEVSYPVVVKQAWCPLFHFFFFSFFHFPLLKLLFYKFSLMHSTKCPSLGRCALT